MEITITRALSELKTLQNRYGKGLEGLNIVAVKQGNKLCSPNSSYKVEDFIDNAASGLQSAEDIYSRIIKIKTAIDKSNSVTKIVIGQKEMTIQEALVQKKYIDLRKDELRRLQVLARNARNIFEEALKDNQLAIERMDSGQLGRDGATEAQKAEARKDAEEYVEKSKAVELIDPCKIDTLIKTLETEITEFETNIDYALSESNSTTKIEI